MTYRSELAELLGRLTEALSLLEDIRQREDDSPGALLLLRRLGPVETGLWEDIELVECALRDMSEEEADDGVPV
jgi:hypothetical protein